MTTETTPRNGSPRVRPDRVQVHPRTETETGLDEKGSFGRAVNFAGAESSLTFRDRVGNFLDDVLTWARDLLVPPAHLVAAPPGWGELTAYAHNGVRMQKAPALLQGLSALWLYAIALPAVVVIRTVEWVLSRPGRALLSIAVTELFLRTTGAGHWLAALIRSGFHLLAIIFLP
jgi:hypothetical protein